MIEQLRTIGAIALGLVLASFPFVMFGVASGHTHGAGAHMDHLPRFGGQLGMVGDHHLELVRKDGRVLVYASDAARRPLRALRGSVRFDDGAERELVAKRFKLEGPDDPSADEATCSVWLVDGAHLQLSFLLDWREAISPKE